MNIDTKLNAIVKAFRADLENLEIQTSANLREAERVIKDNVNLQNELHVHIKEADFKFKERALKLENEYAKQQVLTRDMELEREKVTNIVKEQDKMRKSITDNLSSIEAQSQKSTALTDEKNKLAVALKAKILECEAKMDSAMKLKSEYEEKVRKCDVLEKDLIRQKDEAGRKSNDLDAREANLRLQEKEAQRERTRLKLG